MANSTQYDKQIAIIGQLAEGSSIHSIERITGVHRDTIMRLGVRIGQRCTRLMDEKMRDLPCNRLEMDETWGFVGKKDAHVRHDDNAWSHATGNPKNPERHVTVLHIDPARTPLAAVRAYILQEYRNAKTA